MSNYTKTTNFATKDSLASGNPNKIVKGAEINSEFDNIATAVATKADTASPSLTGTVTAAALNVTGNLDVDGTLEFDSISGTGSVAVTDIADEDNMSSNSATKLATQQSIKAYVDAQVTAQDLDLTDGTTSISIDLDSEALSVLGGTGIDSTASGNGVTLAIDSTVTTLTGSQTLTNKTLTSPDVNTPDIDGGTIDGTVIGGSSAAAGSFTTVGATGNITVGGTVDGRDVATDGTKLDGIEASATADQTNAEIRTAVEAASDSNVFTDADHSKLNAIEASADVTDTANVTSAGALMDSELTAIASVKALNQGVATTDSPTFVDVTATSLDISGNIDVDGTTNLDVVDIDGAVDMASTLAVGGVVTANAGLVVDNITIDGNEIDVSSGDLTLDVAGEIILDADSTGIVRFEDAGTEFGRIYGSNNNLNIKSTISNEDMLFIGNDGGSTITALTLDMSAAGAATFNDNITIGAGKHLRFSNTAYITPENNVSGAEVSTAGTFIVKTGSTPTTHFQIAADGSPSTPTAGTSNVRFGVNAGNSIASGGNYNTVVGDEAGTDITTGDSNTGVGYGSLNETTTGGSNTAVGVNSLEANTTGSNNTAVGVQALDTNTTASNNTAVGYLSLTANTTGTNNTATGSQSLQLNTTGSSNSAFGRYALLNNTTASQNTAVGRSALQETTTGDNNTGLGYRALYLNTTGAVNTAVGANSLDANTTGVANTAIGRQALTSNTTANFNTALGAESLSSNSTGASNTSVGYNSLAANTTGGTNVAVGYAALDANTTGAANVAIGNEALGANTTANANTGIGNNALLANTTGAANSALGSGALAANTTASNNVAVGYNSLNANTTGASNTAFGKDAGLATTTGTDNTYIGTFAAEAATTASNNTFVGRASGNTVTTGSKNTIVGRYSGNQGGLDIRTSDNNIVLSDGDGYPRGFYHGGDTYPAWLFKTPTASQNAMFIDNTNASQPYGPVIRLTDADPNNSTNYFLACQGQGTSRFVMYSNGNVINTNNSYGGISDVKLKENIVDASSQWDDIKALTVRKYSLKADELDAPNMLGVIAQEVEAAGMGGLVYESPDMDSEHNDLGTVTKQVNYSILYMKAVKALQEAMERIESLETRITTLEG